MSVIDNLEERLAAVQGAFADAPDEAPSLYDPPPDGDYQALSHEWVFFEGGTPKQAFLKLVMQVVNDPEYGGRFLEKVHALEDPERIAYLKETLKKLGANVGELELARDLRPGSDLLNALLDTPLDVTVKTSERVNEKTGKPYVNVYINQALGPPGSAGSQGGGFTARRSVPTSDVPEPAAGDFVPMNPGQGTLENAGDDTVPPSSDTPDARMATLRAQGCTCPNPLSTPPQNDDGCPVPGHGIPF